MRKYVTAKNKYGNRFQGAMQNLPLPAI